MFDRIWQHNTSGEWYPVRINSRGDVLAAGHDFRMNQREGMLALAGQWNEDAEQTEWVRQNPELFHDITDRVRKEIEEYRNAAW